MWNVNWDSMSINLIIQKLFVNFVQNYHIILIHNQMKRVAKIVKIKRNFFVMAEKILPYEMAIGE